MNTTHEIKIRKAKPDYEEGLVFARLFDKTSEGFLSRMLGKEAYENVAFAVHGERICGMVSGYTYNMKKKFLHSILAQSTIGKKGNIRRFHFVGSILKRAMGAKHPGEYYLQAIIVTEDHRGRGLGKNLMNWIEDDAIGKKAQTLALDVASKNNCAIILYQRQGMTIDSRWPRFPLLPSVFTRMRKKL
jgi:ribosomal protein S18 acetylase RimI-like enzyme